jgi:hypothetical protein
MSRADKQVVGHAAVFNTEADLGFFRELVVPGAFRDATEGRDDVRALWNHNPDTVLGRTRNRTLTLAEDSRGLAVRFTPADTGAGRDALTLIGRGDVDQMSFQFVALEEEWLDAAGVKPLRRLLRVRLLDVSPVSFAAYPTTTVTVAPGTPADATRDTRRRELERLDSEALEAAGYRLDADTERWVGADGDVLPMLPAPKAGTRR